MSFRDPQVDLAIDADTVPDDIAALLDQADRLSAQVTLDADSRPRIAEFVGSNYRVAYRALLAIVEQRLAPGFRFCEWGSGLGVVTCLASRLGFDATGIEVEPRLVECARRFAAEFAPAARFVEGSYKPEGLYTGTVDAALLDAALGFSPTDFDLVYAYPWPAEEKAVTRLFELFASEGALLLTYHGGARIRLRRR